MEGSTRAGPDFMRHANTCSSKELDSVTRLFHADMKS
jgi:hypothetical protein